MTHVRSQRTLRRPAEVTGVGFFTGEDVALRFLPAAENHGLAFQRVDLPGSKPIPARLESTISRDRRTSIARDGAVVELTEHVLAALAGLQVDNCLIEINAAEVPGCDGSSLAFAEALLAAGIVEQSAPRERLIVEHVVKTRAEDCGSEIVVKPLSRPALALSYLLDYGPRSPIPAQTLTVEITPESFMEELAWARTFVLESEVQALQAQGYGKRTTAKDLLVFGPHGPIDNAVRASDECVRHKILDCLGDFALLGCDLQGHFAAYRSGHRLNREAARRVGLAHGTGEQGEKRRVA